MKEELEGSLSECDLGQVVGVRTLAFSVDLRLEKLTLKKNYTYGAKHIKKGTHPFFLRPISTGLSSACCMLKAARVEISRRMGDYYAAGLVMWVCDCHMELLVATSIDSTVEARRSTVCTRVQETQSRHENT